MKTMRLSAMPMMAIILTAFAIPAAAQKQVPFKGTFQANDLDSACSPPQDTCIVVTSTGTGIGTLVGQFSFRLQNTVNLLAGTEVGSAHLIAANGDTIDATVVGSGEVLDNGLISITETFTITGGTGRFAGAQGIFIVERLASPVTFMTSGSFHGTITSPGAAH
jgi:hypothetical protein